MDYSKARLSATKDTKYNKHFVDPYYLDEYPDKYYYNADEDVDGDDVNDFVVYNKRTNRAKAINGLTLQNRTYNTDIQYFKENDPETRKLLKKNEYFNDGLGLERDEYGRISNKDEYDANFNKFEYRKEIHRASDEAPYNFYKRVLGENAMSVISSYMKYYGGKANLGQFSKSFSVFYKAFILSILFPAQLIVDLGSEDKDDQKEAKRIISAKKNKHKMKLIINAIKSNQDLNDLFIAAIWVMLMTDQGFSIQQIEEVMANKDVDVPNWNDTIKGYVEAMFNTGTIPDDAKNAIVGIAKQLSGVPVRKRTRK